MHIGIVAPLPPEPVGAAEFVLAQLPHLEKLATITCFVDDVEAVDPDIRAKHTVKPLADRFADDVDVVVYHIGNNPHHQFVLDALAEGPAGIVEVHDASMHHHFQNSVLAYKENPHGYVELGRRGHGWAGQQLAEMRIKRFRGVSELFLYDYLVPVLEEAKGVIVHNQYAGNLVHMHRKDLKPYLVPHHAVRLPDEDEDRSWTGIPEGKFLFANLGFITHPKRPLVSIDALAELRRRGLDAHLVFAGRNDLKEELTRAVTTQGLLEHVTITGFLETEDLERWVRTVDAVVNLRAPHVGESSGSLAYSLAAGKPVIVQPIGSWAEIPAEAVVRIPVTDNDSMALADALYGLGREPIIRAQIGARAQAYARNQLDPLHCAELLVAAASDVVANNSVPSSWSSPGRIPACQELLSNGKPRMKALLEDDEGTPEQLFEMLTGLTPSRSSVPLLAVDIPPRYLQVLGALWGFDVSARNIKKATTVKTTAKAGLTAYSAEVKKLTDDDLVLASKEAIVLSTSALRAIDADLHTALSRCNEALRPQGQLIILDADSVSSEDLDRAGFSQHVMPDNPAWSKDLRRDFAHITYGTKATVPASVVPTA